MIDKRRMGAIWAGLMVLGVAIGMILQYVFKWDWGIAVSSMIAVAIAFMFSAMRRVE